MAAMLMIAIGAAVGANLRYFVSLWAAQLRIYHFFDIQLRNVQPARERQLARRGDQRCRQRWPWVTRRHLGCRAGAADSVAAHAKVYNVMYDLRSCVILHSESA